jgi:hypothetical protein
MLLDRGPNLMMLYGWFIEVQRKIILTWLGLNRVYHAVLKWIDEIEASPPFAARKLKRRFT